MLIHPQSFFISFFFSVVTDPPMLNGGIKIPPSMYFLTFYLIRQFDYSDHIRGHMCRGIVESRDIPHIWIGGVVLIKNFKSQKSNVWTERERGIRMNHFDRLATTNILFQIIKTEEQKSLWPFLDGQHMASWN